MRTFLVLGIAFIVSCYNTNKTIHPETRSRYYLEGKILSFKKLNDSLCEAEFSITNKAPNTHYKNLLIEVYCMGKDGDTLAHDGALTGETIHAGEKKHIRAEFAITEKTEQIQLDCISGMAETNTKNKISQNEVHSKKL